MQTGGSSVRQLAFSATLHCLTGCAIGEVLGMVIGTGLGWSDAATIALSVALAFLFGYSLTLRPLLASGIAFAAAARLALAADTLSITVIWCNVGCWGMAPRPSADFRERLVAALDAGLPPSEAATRFHVSERTLYRWLARPSPRRVAGRAAPLRAATEAPAGALCGVARAGEHPARRDLARTRGPAGSRHRDPPQPLPPESDPAPARSAAQKKSLIAAERDEEAARVAWREEMAAVDPTDLVLLDETSTPPSLTPLRARAPRGQRAVGRVPRGKRPHHLLAGHPDQLGERLGESLLVQGAVDRETSSRPSSHGCWCRSCGQARSWCWTISRCTRSPAPGASSKGLAAGCSSCRPTRRTSIPSSRPSPRSSRPCAASGPAPGRPSWPRLGKRCPPITAADARAFFTEAGFRRDRASQGPSRVGAARVRYTTETSSSHNGYSSRPPQGVDRLQSDVGGRQLEGGDLDRQPAVVGVGVDGADQVETSRGERGDDDRLGDAPRGL